MQIHFEAEIKTDGEKLPVRAPMRGGLEILDHHAYDLGHHWRSAHAPAADSLYNLTISMEEDSMSFLHGAADAMGEIK